MTAPTLYLALATKARSRGYNVPGLEARMRRIYRSMTDAEKARVEEAFFGV